MTDPGIYSADHLRDHWKRQHRLSLNTCRMARAEPRYYRPGDQAAYLADAGAFRKAITLLAAYAHPVRGFCGSYLTAPECRALRQEAGL